MHANFQRLVWLLSIALLATVVGCGDDDDVESASDDDTTDDDAGDDDNVDDDNVDDDSVDDDTIDDDTTLESLQPNTIFQIEGSDSVNGDYTGTVEIRGADDEPNFIRLIRFNDLSFADPRLEIDYEVHAAWTGQIDLTTGAIDVELQVADFAVEYGGVTRTEEDGDPVIIEGEATSARGDFQAQFATVGGVHELTATETWSEPAPAGAKPTFISDDFFVVSHEEPPGWLKTTVNLILNSYHQLEFFDSYRDRPEFAAMIHYFPHYRTDFDWYRAHPGAIRVVNKWVDQVSMLETMLRARGFAPTLAEKAAAFDADMPELFLNPLGFVSLALVPSDPLQQSESGDALLWNGCYLASQVFRWLVTGEQEAFDNWLRILDAQFLAHDIPQDPTTFARAVRPHVADGSKEWIPGVAPYEAYDWLSPGNNDMIQGLYYAYTLSWIYLPDDAAYDEHRAKIADHARLLADYCSVANDGGFNEIKANWLAWMTTGEGAYRTRYQELWNKFTNQIWAGGGDGMFYIYGISDWSGQHLDTIGHLILQFLAEGTGEPGLTTIANGWQNGMLFNGVSRQVLWPIAAYAFTDPPARYDEVLAEARWSLREFPYPKQSFPLDQRLDPKWCASPLPSLPWKLDWMQGGRFQGLYATPLWERDVSTNNYVAGPFHWNSPATDWTDGGGPDYLHAYWLGRYYGVITPEE